MCGPCQSFWDYRERYRQCMETAAAMQTAEPGQGYENLSGPLPVNERLVQTIWAQQLIQGSGLRLVGGATLRVLDPGRWNGAAGPDFRDASLLIDGQPVAGDVEIHLEACDWSAHGHHRDLDFNNVILHACLRSPDGRKGDARHNGTIVPRFEMEPYVFPDLETLRRSLTPDDFEYTRPQRAGRCFELMRTLSAQEVGDFLDRAGDERLVGKMQRLEDQLADADLEQVFYQALLTALGSGSGRTLFYLLAKRTPIAELCDYVRDWPEARWPMVFESLLLHVAGLAPGEAELREAPAEARERADQLRRIWDRLEPYWADRLIPPTRRWFKGIRPVNFPTRRLAAVACLLSRSLREGRCPLDPFVERLVAGAASLRTARPTRRRHPLLRELVERLTVSGHGHFWGRHYSFTARPAPCPMNLIGEGAATSLLLNAVLPAALLHARVSGDETALEATERLFGFVPPLQPNHITEFMTRRLFEEESAKALINTERRRQGLFQIFHHCCKGEERDCARCYYFTNPAS